MSPILEGKSLCAFIKYGSKCFLAINQITLPPPTVIFEISVPAAYSAFQGVIHQMKKNLVRLSLGITALIVCFLMTGSPSSAHQIDRNNIQRLANLSSRIASLGSDLSKAKSQGEMAHVRIAQLAAERFDAMVKAAENDPLGVDNVALSDSVLARIPADLQQYFEKREDLQGDLEVIAECEKADSRMLYFLKTASGRFSLHFTKEPKAKLLTGMKVRVKGIRFDDSVVVNEDSLTNVQTDAKTSLTNAEPTAPSSASALSNTLGDHKVLVILVNFQDKQTQPFTTDQARDVTFNTTSNYYRETSYGQTWLTGDVYGWFTIPVSSTNCDTAAIATYAKQAATSAGANLSAYNHYVYGFPQNTGCGFSGRGSVGGNPGEVWINQYFDVNAVGHELGHNLGLFHSRSMDCGAAVVSGSCTTSEYGDVFDIMGGGASAHMNLFQKEQLGWVGAGASPLLQTVTSPGTYWVDAYETVGSTVKGLKILKSTDPVTGKRTWYYVEHRTANGFDSYLSGPNYNVVNGVSVHMGSEVNGMENYLLDMTPATSSWYDPALLAGQSFSDPDAGLTISTISADSTGALVQISVAQQPCTHSNPNVTVTPGQTQWLNSGTTFTYSVTVADNDGAGCGESSFYLQSNVPAGWTASYSDPKLNITPGGTATTDLYVTSPAGTLDGTYNVGAAAVNASDPAYTGASSTTYSIVSELAVTATSGAIKYTRTQKATVTAVVRAGGSTMAGVSVVFTMTKPNGSVVTQTNTTGTNGTAVFIYSFDRRRDPLGTYQVQAVSNVNGLKGQGTASFVVNK